jgi:hypothetical protein
MKVYPHPHHSCCAHHRYIDLDESEIAELPDVLVTELGRMTVGASHLSSLVFQVASGPRTSRFTMHFADIDAFQLEFCWRDRRRATQLTVPRDVYTLGHSEWRRNNVWRLTDATIETYSRGLGPSIEKTLARYTEATPQELL